MSTCKKTICFTVRFVAQITTWSLLRTQDSPERITSSQYPVLCTDHLTAAEPEQFFTCQRTCTADLASASYLEMAHTSKDILLLFSN